MSARRSYLQLLFEQIGLPFLPTYNDFQFKWSYEPNKKNRFTVLGLGAIDQFELNTGLADDPTSEDFERNRFILDLLSVDTQWNYAIGAKWDQYVENGRWTYVVSRNMLNNRSFKHQDNDESLPLTRDYVSQEIENKVRVERKWFLENDIKITGGVNYEYAKFNNNSAFDEFSFATGEVNTLSFESAFDMHKYGAFGQISKSLLSSRLVLSAGLRMDANEYSSSMQNPLDQLSPRLSASYAITPELSANFNTGIYYQLPAYTILGYEENGVLQNRLNDITYIRNKQVVAGLQYDINERNSLITLEGFYKDYDNYPFSVDKGISLANLGADFGVIGNEEVTSTG
ncbi:MAG: TonB-dependent receptor, partial [Bacteroidota bacterium]